MKMYEKKQRVGIQLLPFFSMQNIPYNIMTVVYR